MLPKEGNLFEQDKFITGYLKNHFAAFNDARIHYLGYLGNDDLKIFDPLFEETCRAFPFVHDIAQRVLLHFWGLIERELNVVSLSRHRPEELFQLLTTSDRMKPAKALQVLGGLSLIQSIGIRGFRSIMGKTSNRTWQRLKKNIENCTILGGPRVQMMRQIRESLVEFLPINSKPFSN